MSLLKFCFLRAVSIISIISANSFAFLNNGVPACRMSRSSSTTTTLKMVFGPKQALAIEKRKNPQAFESTIQGLMKTKGLSRADAEKVRALCEAFTI